MLLGARQFFERSGAPTPPLPYDAEVEYLEITRYDSGVVGPYIDTGIVVAPTDKVSVDWQGLSTWANDLKLFGSYFGYGWATFYGGVWRPLVSGFVQSSSLRDTNRHTIVFENHTCFLDGTSIASGSGNFSDISFYLFTINGQPLTSSRLEQRVYSLSIERSGEKVLDMIPVRFTNELGVSEGAMYDRVSGQLFRNAGTGSFTIGPDKTSWTNPYVTDGLVAMWDGEWNAGGGVHDPNATEWVDLSGGNHPFTYLKNGFWLDDGWQNSGDVANMRSFAGYDYVTCEMVVKPSATYRINNIRKILTVRPLGGIRNILMDASNNVVARAGSNVPCATFPSGANGVKISFAFVYSDTVVAAYANGAVSSSTGYSTWNSNIYNSEGGGNLLMAGDDTNSGCGDMVIHALRLHSRALTAAEIAANYAIDKARFNLP